MCFGFSLICMPQSKEVLEIHKSFNPGLMNVFIISFLRDTGVKKLGFLSKNSSKSGKYLFVLKKYASSFALVTSLLQSGQR